MKKLLYVAMISSLFGMPVYGQENVETQKTIETVAESASGTDLMAQFETALQYVTDTETKYTTTVVNIRKEPNIDSEILGTSLVGTSFEIVATIDGWSMIITEDGYAYMKSDWFVNDVSEIPNKTLLGRFRITHYCGCRKCNGKWTGSPTHSGRYPEDGITIAVEPSQIPFGSWVEINGHKYRADDSGSAIKANCIDIYVSNHQEALRKGKYYTDVYLIND